MPPRNRYYVRIRNMRTRTKREITVEAFGFGHASLIVTGGDPTTNQESAHLTKDEMIVSIQLEWWDKGE